MNLDQTLASAFLCLCATNCIAGESPSPEAFMRENYGWTIAKIDEERGVFGDYKNFTCLDDRLSPPKNAEEETNRRWGTQCFTKRNQGENLGAMIFVTWTNPKHSKPISKKKYEHQVADVMANEKDGNSEPNCEKQTIEARDRQIELYDCSMTLPFGTFFASYLKFQHRGINYFIRAANASQSPDSAAPKEKIRKIYKSLAFDQ